MDAVDPALVDQVEEVLRGTPGVMDLGQTRVRWIGHNLRAECQVVVAADLSVVEGHLIAEECEHQLLHELPRLSAAMVHADPVGHVHEMTDHHAR
jgi:divalent metal cation (Fe/Co/Zn/Cd) transporter